MTSAQKRTLDFIVAFVGANGVAPTVRQIAVGTNLRISSVSIVHAHLLALEDAGAIERDYRKRQAIRVCGRCPHCGQAIGAGHALRRKRAA